MRETDLIHLMKDQRLNNVWCNSAHYQYRMVTPNPALCTCVPCKETVAAAQVEIALGEAQHVVHYHEPGRWTVACRRYPAENVSHTQDPTCITCVECVRAIDG